MKHLIVMLLLACMNAFGFEEVCNDPKDGIRAKRSVNMPEGTQQAFIAHFRNNGAKDIYSTGEVESGNHLILFLNTSGIYISVDHTSPKRKFLFEIETCNATEDWKPHWNYVNKLVDDFIKSHSF